MKGSISPRHVLLGAMIAIMLAAALAIVLALVNAADKASQAADAISATATQVSDRIETIDTTEIQAAVDGVARRALRLVDEPTDFLRGLMPEPDQ